MVACVVVSQIVVGIIADVFEPETLTTEYDNFAGRGSACVRKPRQAIAIRVDDVVDRIASDYL